MYSFPLSPLGENDRIMHSEQFKLEEKLVNKRTQQSDNNVCLSVCVPIAEPLPPQYYVRVFTEQYVCIFSVFFRDMCHLQLTSHIK
jgi:hypothetical protein